ncbi:hypothetical protein PAXRUDRAFT_822156 [Paxillus rubicundulus Ve08.2h10]|uniref:Uncharacterized protein n=1 Tax=Paxillus rubicundulus Ve08.2h10 TaxID=930991 RepID=A0A0D0ECU4_9AGAM|nr:hypothetical protein PAXRUDRAFT_822156 [Paxillus rubicundulus Ve08.2h10]
MSDAVNFQRCPLLEEKISRFMSTTVAWKAFHHPSVVISQLERESTEPCVWGI